jgi:hypothetical protein
MDDPLVAFVEKIQKEESVFHMKRGYHAQMRDETEREDYLIHMGQLKKFFQSETFVDVNQKAAAKKFTEPIAAVAAGSAAFLATLVEKKKDAQWVSFSYRGVFVLWLGVVGYVLKDRLKDLFRNFFNKKISGQILPDFHRVLFADGKVLGRAKDWYQVIKTKQVPKEVKDARHSAQLNAAERYLHEDIFHYRREFKVRLSDLGLNSKMPGLNEILRINMERYLKHMDDPNRVVRSFNEEGRLVQVKSRKVYQIYAVVVARKILGRRRLWSKKAAEQIEDYHLFRIVADKSGIDRVETVARTAD